MLIEVKDGSKAPSKRKLTADQAEWHKRWPVAVVERVEDVPGVLVGHYALMEAF